MKGRRVHRATAGGGFVMLIPNQSTKFAVRTFPTRNACSNALQVVSLPIERSFHRASEFRFSDATFNEVNHEILHN
jgi:hypothetical protein